MVSSAQGMHFNGIAFESMVYVFVIIKTRWLQNELDCGGVDEDILDIITHNSPKFLEWNVAYEKSEGFFFIKIRNFKVWGTPKL